MARYNRKQIYTIAEVLAHVYSAKELRENPSLKSRIFDNDKLNMTSLRYKVFKFVSCKCKKCGLEGKFFAKEQCIGQEGWHFNLYGYDTNGKEVMLTKDHIKPKSKGGADSILNMECLCVNCNIEKADKWDGLTGH